MNSSKSLLSIQCQSVVLVILLFTGCITSCGPGNRIGSPRKRPFKMSPFVYKQHVPNVSEFTLGASGQPDGAISRGDHRFKDLVENTNNEIIFRDEERDGSDRIMSQRCKEKLDILATMVINQWPGNPPEVPPVKVKVKEAWDDNYLHGENSLHYEGRAVDVATSDRDRSKLGLLARLAVEAGFDWVEYESHGHIHCSVKSDSSAAIKTGGCFSGENMIQVKDVGEIPMADIRLGDEVLSMRSDGVLEYSPVISFMDRDDLGYGLFYTFYTESGKHITLTAKHLLYVINSISLNLNEVEAVFADSVRVGQYLLLRDRDSLITTAINKISVETRRGIYAPLTKHGTIIVDGIVASCYAYIENVFIAHAVFAPMRFFYSISQTVPVLGWLYSDSVDESRNSTNVQTGMHWYANVLYNLGSRVLRRETLYVH